MRLSASIFLLAVAVQAQQPAPSAEPHGTVVVHVTCADTNQPARLASVTLQPVGVLIPDPYASLGAAKSTQPAVKATVLTTVRTSLDGSVTLPNVAPGRYYVVVQYAGYLSPSAQFSREDINHPDEATKALMDKTIPVVVVAAQQSSPVDVRLVHAAVVTGTIRYDDGSPATETTVHLNRRSKAGEWVPAGISSYEKTDDLGHYRINGLAAGEYRLQASLQLSTTTGGNVFGYSGFGYSNFVYTAPFYSGDTLREADAKTFKLTEGENSANNDITIPVSRLHPVSGSLIDAHSGAALNHGRLYLYIGDDKEPIAQTTVDPDLRTFRFPFVLEGEYRLRVSSASEVSREPIPPVASVVYRPQQFKEKPLNSYAEYNAPFSVHTEMTGVTIAMKPSESKPKPASPK